MPTQIMVPLDGSPFSEQALPSAYKIADLAGATVHLVRVARPEAVVPDEAGLDPIPILGAHRQDAEEYLAAQALRVPLRMDVRLAVLRDAGSVAEQLAVYARQAGINLIVMSTHARTGFGRFWNGSEADALIRTINIPILLLRPHEGMARQRPDCWEGRRILIPLDGSQRAEAVLEGAAELGMLTGARFTLMKVVRLPAKEVFPHAVGAHVRSLGIERELRRAREYLQSVADAFALLGIYADTLAVGHRNVAEAIAWHAVANNVDMIAIATHGRGGWNRLAVGSVTQDLLQSARLPMLVIRSAETRADAQGIRSNIAAG